MMGMKRLWLVLQYIIYEVKFYIIGIKAAVDDVVSRKSNVCPLIDAEGCVAVVTGGARGIGLGLVKKLLQCNMTVIIGCRNEETGRQKMEDIRASGIKSGQVFVYPLDLMSFASTKCFANLIRSNHNEVDLLINNAGIMFPPYEESEDGFESQWAVNFLSPALLTYLLLPIMGKSSMKFPFCKRIVNVTSCAYAAAKPIEIEDVNVKEKYLSNRAYAESKLALILFTVELSRQLKELGSDVSAHCVHPGIVDTDLFNGTSLKTLAPWILTRICKTVDDGATSVLFACISTTLTGLGGTYSTNCRLTALGKVASSQNIQKKLYEYAAENLKFQPLQSVIA